MTLLASTAITRGIVRIMPRSVLLVAASSQAEIADRVHRIERSTGSGRVNDGAKEEGPGKSLIRERQ